MQAARPHLSAPCPIGAQTPYLCATLPFLMSEMIRGSPRLLLAAGGEEAETLTPDGHRGWTKAWAGPGMGWRPTHCSHPGLTASWQWANQLTFLCLGFPSVPGW